MRVLQIVTALVAGLIFGFGLSLSGMLDPVKVQGFLDIFGNWDPTLAFVLGGAVVVAFGGVALMRRMSRPVFEQTFHLPDAKRIDGRLVLGSAIFGLGWGLAGFCRARRWPRYRLGSGRRDCSCSPWWPAWCCMTGA